VRVTSICVSFGIFLTINDIVRRFLQFLTKPYKTGKKYTKPPWIFKENGRLLVYKKTFILISGFRRELDEIRALTSFLKRP
jgi:hypothetical protein